MILAFGWRVPTGWTVAEFFARCVQAKAEETLAQWLKRRAS